MNTITHNGIVVAKNLATTYDVGVWFLENTGMSADVACRTAGYDLRRKRVIAAIGMLADWA